MVPKSGHLCPMRHSNRNEVWSGRQDSNLRPSAPKADALPGCATPRHTPPLVEGRSACNPPPMGLTATARSGLVLGLVARHELEHTAGLQNRPWADIEAGFAKRDRPGCPRHLCRSFKPFARPRRGKKVAVHPHGQRNGLRRPPDRRTQKPVGKCHQHAAMCDPARVAVALPDPNAVHEPLFRHLVEERSIVAGVRPPAR